MGYELYNSVGYGCVIKVAQWQYEEKDAGEDMEIQNIGCNMTGKDKGNALVIRDSITRWEENNPQFLVKIPILSDEEKENWDSKMKKWCEDNNVDFEPPTWMIMNWLG